MALWLLGPIAAVAAFAGGFAYERASQKKERAPWRPLVARDARDVAPEFGVGLLAGRADARGRLPALSAPFTGRPCLAYHVEVITRERTPRGNYEEIRWARVFEDAAGDAFISADDGALVGRVEVRGAHPLLPPDLSRTNVPGVTVFSSSSSMFGAGGLPPHLAAFIQRLGLPEARRDTLLRAGRNLIFNERIVVPGQRLSVAGPCAIDPYGAGIVVAGRPDCDVFFAEEDAAKSRARVAALSLSTPLVGASVAGVMAGLVVMTLVAMSANFTAHSRAGDPAQRTQTTSAPAPK